LDAKCWGKWLHLGQETGTNVARGVILMQNGSFKNRLNGRDNANRAK